MFEIVIHDRARKVYERLPHQAARLVTNAIDALRDNPHFGPNIKPLHGELRGLYRVRVGAYRIIYRVDNVLRIVVIKAIGSRGDVY